MLIQLKFPEQVVSISNDLTVNRVWLELNPGVNAGDTIGLSGHVWISTEPHLHRNIKGAYKQRPCQTLPFAFKNCNDRTPVSGRAYWALTYYYNDFTMS